MFLGKNYILANELVQKMGIHIANISMLRQQYEDENDMSTMIKMNNCTMVKTNSHKFPNNIKMGIAANEFTDMSNKLPCTFVREEYEITEKELFKGGIIKGKVKVAGKDFYEFTEEFVKTTKNKIVYCLDESDTMACMAKGQIDGYIQVSKNKYVTWYGI